MWLLLTNAKTSSLFQLHGCEQILLNIFFMHRVCVSKKRNGRKFFKN